jgi:hypothetical protein
MDEPRVSTAGEMSMAEAATLLGISRKRAAEYSGAGVLPHRTVPSRYRVLIEWRVATEHVLALDAARRASRQRHEQLRAEGWQTVAEVAEQRGVVASTITRAIARGALQAEQFPHETGTPYLIAPEGMRRRARTRRRRTG